MSISRGLHWRKPPAPPVESLPLPDRLLLPVAHHNRRSASLLVEAGQAVKKGQVLTAGTDHHLVLTHASTSGTIRTINNHTIELIADGRDEAIETPAQERKLLSRSQLIDLVHNAGLIGHGGAGFPLALKLQHLSASAALLLVNAAECDPDIHCDDALLQTKSTDIVAAVLQVAEICNITKIVIGIEDNKPLAMAALQQALADLDHAHRCEIVTVPALYPSGAERLLLERCTGRRVAADTSLAADGVLSMNVASCYALGRVLSGGLAPISRITTVVTADRVSRNVELRIGTPLEVLISQLMPHNSAADQPLSVTEGGRMMFRHLNLEAAITQRSNCIAIDHVQQPEQTVACIRCGVCADVCPVALQPQRLHKAAVSFDAARLKDEHLERCIACRNCDAVCPSHIPLAAQFSDARLQLTQQENEAQAAELAKQRFEKRERRLQLAQQGKRRKRVSAKKTTTAPQSRKDLIAQALARSSRKKSGSEPDSGPDRIPGRGPGDGSGR